MLKGLRPTQQDSINKGTTVQGHSQPAPPCGFVTLQASQIAAQDAQKKAAAFEGISIEV